jgi:branched-chain amino acid transport system ATP-binding protein
MKRRGGLLSGGEQRMLSVARVLGRQPALVMADELSMGLAPRVVHRILETLRAAADEGVGVLVVEQHVRQALRFADRGYVLRRGQIALEGRGRDLAGRIHEIEETYLSVRNESSTRGRER